MNIELGLFRPERLLPALALTGLASVANASDPQVFYGTPVAVGNGTARVVVTVNGVDEPESVAVVMSQDALQNLPDVQGEKMVWEFSLPMPEVGPNTGYNHVVLDWNPVGHVPEGIFNVPHFDVHFYLISGEEREAITFHGSGRELAMKAPDPQLVPAGYVIPPDAAVDRMGMHGLDPAGREFNGQPFTHNFIYGYHKGELMFVEPMVSLAFLQSLPDATSQVKKPERYSHPAWYPGTYRIAFDAGKGEYSISLQSLGSYNNCCQTARLR